MRPITHHRWLFGAATLVFIASAACKDSTGPSTGAVQVTVTTTGAEPDPNGYSVAVDGAAGQAIPINGAVTLSGLGAGGHSVLLAGLAPNCATGGGANPRPVAVVAGAAAQVAFSVTCVATMGSLVITLATTGVDLDPDGYGVSVDGGAAQAVTGSGTITLSALSAGNHSVSLGGVALNCAATPSSPISVDITAGVAARLNIAVTCIAKVGGIEQIAFASDRDGNYEIYVMNGDGSRPTRLTTAPGSDVEPAWSPDGTRIAFVSHRDGGDGGEIYVMNADGSSPTRLTNHDPATDDRRPAWSPDGSRIAFMSDRSGYYDIYVMNADGSGQTRLTAAPGYNADPTWSPDGTRIAFTSDRNGGFDVFVMHADGSGPVPLTADGSDAEPSWSSDGRKIVFDSQRDGNLEIYVMSADGSGQTRLTNNLYDEFEPAWAPDGTKIAFTQTALFCDPYGDCRNAWIISVMNADGSGRHSLTFGSSNSFEPSWRPPSSAGGSAAPRARGH